MRRRGVVSHREVNTCDGSQQFDRNRGGALDAIGLPAHVHRLLSTAYLRAMRSVSSKRGRPKKGRSGGPDGSTALNAGGPEDEDMDGSGPNQGGADEAVVTLEPVSVWRQTAQERISGVTEWMLSGTCLNDLVFARLHYKPAELLMLRQLAISGSSWERKQQGAFLDGGLRSYQVSEAHGGDSENRFCEEISKLSFDGREWRILESKTEEDNMKAFRLLSRSGAASYYLLKTRHRWYPYLTFRILIDDDKAEQFKTAPACTLDEFSLGFRQHYGVDNITGECARAELIALLANLETDTASTEREHSTNERRNQFRVMTHDQTLPQLSAWFCGRKCCGERGDASSTNSKGKGIDAAGGKKESSQPAPDRDAYRKCWSWAWKAYLHVQARGRFLSADVNAELSSSYSRLTDEEKAFYVELGALAADRKASGQPSFVPVPRKKKKTTEPKHQALAPPQGSSSSVQVSCAAPDAAPAIADCAPTLPRVSKISEEARSSKRDRASSDAVETQNDQRLRQSLQSYSRAESADRDCVWNVVGGANSQGPAVSSGSADLRLEPGPLIVASWHRTPEVMVGAAIDHLQKTSVDANDERWRKLHHEVRLEDCPKLGRVATKRKPCFEAQRCLCTGDGLALATTIEQFRRVLAQARGAKADFNAMLRRGTIVLCIEWPVNSSSPDTTVGPSPDSPAPVAENASIWIHVSLVYERPLVLTLLLMERDAARDRPGLLV